MSKLKMPASCVNVTTQHGTTAFTLVGVAHRSVPTGTFPPPWSVEEQDACFAVRDHNGKQLAYVYFEDEPGRRSAAKLLSKDEARRIAVLRNYRIYLRRCRRLS